MNKKEIVEEEIRKTLDMFEQKESLPPNPYFYTRMQQRIKENSANNSTVWGYLKPALVIGLFVVNVGTFVWFFNSSDVNDAIDSRQELIEILSGDFNLDNDQNNIFLP